MPACKKEASPVGPDQNFVQTSVGDSIRMVVLDSLESRINSLAGSDRNVSNQAILTYLQSRSEFEASGIETDGSVWGRFTDGRLFVFANNFSAPDTGAPPGIPGSAMFRPAFSSFAQVSNLPQNSDARLLNSLGSAFDYTGFGLTGFSETITDLAAWFNSAGYTPVSGASAAVNALKSVAGDGVFYWSAHGAFGKDRPGNKVYGVWTSTERDTSWEFVYKKDLDDGNLIYFSAPHEKGSLLGKDVSKIHYAITAKFVTQYMSFGQNSVVFINACSSFDQAFRDACKTKGAGMYIGWTAPTNPHDAVKSARFYFDRMLGTNMQDPVENPPQRPFDHHLIVEDMYYKGLDVSGTAEYGPAALYYDESAGDVDLLAPSILQAYIFPIPGDNDFYIDGLFGDNPAGGGTVLVGGSPLTIKLWQPTKITCSRPTTGGDLVVRVRGRQSNAIQLTQWSVTIDYTVTGPGTLKRNIVMNVDLISDIHSFRLRPAVPPIFFNPRYTHTLGTSSCTYECSGEYRDEENELIEAWSGSGSVPLYVTMAEPVGFNVVAVIDSVGKTSYFNILFSGFFIRTTSAGPSQEQLRIDYSLGNMETSMSASFSFPGNSVSDGNGTETAVLTWGAMNATFPPDPNAPR